MLATIFTTIGVVEILLRQYGLTDTSYAAGVFLLAAGIGIKLIVEIQEVLKERAKEAAEDKKLSNIRRQLDRIFEILRKYQ